MQCTHAGKLLNLNLPDTNKLFASPLIDITVMVTKCWSRFPANMCLFYCPLLFVHGGPSCKGPAKLRINQEHQY